MNDMLEKPKALALRPPAARAPNVLEQRPVLEQELADLKGHIAEVTLAAYEGSPLARRNLVALDDDIRAVTFQLEGNAAAHELARRLDREAVAAWFADLQENPEKAVEGITKKECCKRCSEQHGCTITGGLQCGHPVHVGSVGPALMGNPKVRAVFTAAAKKVGRKYQ